VTPRTALRAAVVAVLGLGVGACATPALIAPPPPISSVPPRVEAPPPPTPSLPSERERLAALHIEASDRFEKAGELRRALDESKIALTINPGDAKAQEARKRLEGLIARGVTQRIDEGRAALARGAYVEARRRFLAALALDPTNPTAQEALRNQAREMDTVNHTVRGGDTLASLAQQYYGDSARAEVIADSNGLALNTRLTPGRTIKVPEIPGVPFRPPGRTEGVAALPPLTPPPAAAPTPAPPGAAEAAIPPPPPPAPPPPPERNVLLAGAENALQKRQYTAALSDIDRFLAQNPGNAEGLAVRKQALYGVAKSQFEGKNYDGAYRSLSELAKVAPGYEDSSTLIQESRRRMIDQHYSQGIRFYREEKLKEAIAEWRIVLELDPQHANAKKNIEQSEKLLKGLEERRKK
jgi:tetratricopeptide (TPR) repeat protein